MRTLPSFTQAFFSHLPANDVAGTSQQEPLAYSSEKYKTVDRFIRSADFASFKKEYEDLLDRITAFVYDNADQLDPPLLKETRDSVKDDFHVLKQHLFDSQENFFGSHKPVVYGRGKKMFHDFDELLQNECIPLQQRIQSVVGVADKMRVCSGGLLSDLQEAMAMLKGSN